MRQQYHFRKANEDTLVWDVKRLADLAKNLPVKNIALEEIQDLDDSGYWYNENCPPTHKSVAEHAKLIQSADLHHPIILCAEGRVMDGMHRVCKALIEGHPTIKAVRFQTTPEPDFKNIDMSALPYNSAKQKASVRALHRPKIALITFMIVALIMLGLILSSNGQKSIQKAEIFPPLAITKTEEKPANIFNPFTQKPEDPVLTNDRAEHILHGNQNSGGHLYGTGRPCKSEFPSSWDATKILDGIKEIAANDNLSWQQEANGYVVAEGKKDGVRIRVVLSDDRSRIITGYPTNMPRNPCLVPANDNIKSEPVPITPD